MAAAGGPCFRPWDRTCRVRLAFHFLQILRVFNMDSRASPGGDPSDIFAMTSLPASKPIKVLIIDDSAVVRRLLSESLEGEDDIAVVGTAPDPYVAREKILVLQPDVITLDIDMPRMDGITFLKRLMQYHPLPVIIISALGQSSGQAALAAMQAGAVEVLAKPTGPYSLGDLRLSLAQKIRAAAATRPRLAASLKPRPASPERISSLAFASADSRPIVVLGASTGGTEAIHAVLAQLPMDCPPILIAQHIPAGFSRAFAERLNRRCPMEVKEAEEGDPVVAGRVLIAPGNLHLRVHRSTTGYQASVQDGPLVCCQRPAVDVLFHSAANLIGRQVIAVLLTGMGSDGAQGMLALRRAGARTIAQDEATCAVYGMPREAARLGAAEFILPLPRIADQIMQLASRPVTKAS